MFLRRTFNYKKFHDRIYSTLEMTKVTNIESVPVPESIENSKKSTCLLDEIVNETIEKTRKQTWADKLKKIQTVEEKLIKINMPKYYGYKVVKLEDSKTPYNSMGLTKHYTNTHFEEVEEIPDYYKEYSIDEISKTISAEIVDSIEFANDYYKFQGSIEEQSHSLDETIVQQINRCLLKNLQDAYSHLTELETDINPRHEAFWWTGGIEATKQLRGMYEGREHTKKKVNDPTTRAIQYTGRPYLALRHNLLLKPYVDSSEIQPNKITDLIPLFEYDARTLGYSCEHRHGTIIPGYWPGNVNEFGFLNFQRRNNSFEINKLLPAKDEIIQEAIHIKGIQSSFAWLFAQACYQGFSNFEDVTYPFTTQTIITDGRKWSFYGYQLNTTLARNDNTKDNSKYNTCWGTKEMKLFEQFDENGKCIGFNEDVLKNLIKFYANKPIVKQDKKIERISDIKDDDRREFLEKVYKHLCANRPGNRLVPEIYTWEKIYKIDHKTRPLESKRRFFELGINPFDRQLDHHKPVYIPRDLRPDGYKSKKRWTKTYYP